MSTVQKNKTRRNDLPDTPDDISHLQPDEGVLDLPDVKDIPGQEHVRPLPPGEMADVTISSADEEGAGILDEEEDEEITEQFNANVTKDERDLLKKSEVSMGTKDDLALEQAALDKTDDDGTPLNERIDQSGSDLDVPGTEEDASDEDDEENNPYSLNDDKEDEITNRQ